MTETLTEVRVGHPVPDFSLNCYDPVKHDFTRFSLADAKAQNKWTVMFFYPADFTFV